MKKVILTVIVTLLLMNGSVLMAEIFPALELERNSTGYSGPGPVLRTHGWEFTVTEDLAVAGLGIFDLFDDGLYLPHEIGIWRSGDLVYSTTVPAGTEGTVLIDQFRYIETEPFWLTAGETYVIGNTTVGDPFVGNNNLARITTLPSITYERTLISPSDSGFSLPTLEQEFYLFGPNFLVVPEPMTLVMLGVGGLLLRRRYSK
ncbi:MAG TPA: PEP-CTERM sorting domain-containing protein [Planctomycetes bacterium]|nr:PEP-CTERM sorting domain-containing protein [Planctomycetota bacterium]